MNQKLTHTLPSLAVGGLLLAAGALAAMSGARTSEVDASTLVGALRLRRSAILGVPMMWHAISPSAPQPKS